MHRHDTMKTIAKAYLSSRGCSFQEAVYLILSELKLRRIFSAVYFVNTNLPEERVQVLLPEKNDFMRNNAISKTNSLMSRAK